MSHSALSSNMLTGMLSGKNTGSSLYCVGVGKVMGKINDDYIVELAFQTSSFDEKSQQVIARKAGLFGYKIEIGDMVLLGQARTLGKGFKRAVDLSVCYILDKLTAAKGMSLTVLDSFDFLDQSGKKILSITPSGVKISQSVTVTADVKATSVEASGVKLESHFHQPGLLVSPTGGGPVTGTTGGPV